MKRLYTSFFVFTTIVASMLAMLFYTPTARANIYATDIKLSGSLTNQTVGAGSGVPMNITFILNQAATYGTTINILSNGVSVRALTNASGGQGALQGLNTVPWDGNDGGGNPIAPGTYSVSITAAAASLGTNWTQFTVNNKSNSLNSAFGVAINNNPNSPYYGRVFVGNKLSGTSGPGLACQNAIMKLNADCSPADEGLFGTAGATLHNNGFAPFGLRYDSANDLVYFLDFNLQGDLYSCDMRLTANQHVLAAANYASNPHSDVRTGNGFHTFDVVGSGNNGMFFMGDAGASGAGVYFWPMANGVASGTSGTQVVSVGAGSSQISIADGGIFVTTNNTVYVGQTIGSTFGDSGTLGVSSANPVVEAFTWNGSTVVTAANIWAADANSSSFEGTWDIGLDNRANPNYVAVPFAQGTSAQGGIQILNGSTGAQVALMDNNREYWGVAFDGVGNVYGCESTAGYIRGYSPPGNSTNTTVAYSTVTITNAQPKITQQPTPSSLTTNQGASVTYAVTASGTPTLSYQWTVGGTNLSGQTASSITMANLQTSNNGSYAVVVSNLYGSITSSVVNLTVAAMPQVVVNPQSRFVYTNGSASFFVSAIGSQPLSYQWKLGSSNISGATASSLVLSNLQAANAGSYSCFITNVYGSTNSTSATLTVLQPVQSGGYVQSIMQDNPIAFYRLDESSGTTAHDSVGGNDGQYANVTLGVSGYSPIDPDTASRFGPGPNSYVGNIQGLSFGETNDNAGFTLECWVNGSSSQVSGAGIIAEGNGGGGEQFDLDVYGGVYRFFVRDANAAGPPSGNVTANVGPNGTWQHVVAVYDGPGSQALYLYVNGNQVGTTPASANGILASTHPMSIGSRQSTSNAYDDNFVGKIDEVAIYGVALNGTQVYNHYNALLNWPGFPPLIASQPQPASATVYPNGNAAFTITAGGDLSSMTYQWALNGTNINGANNSIYTVSAAQYSDGGQYSCLLSNNYGTSNSANALLTVLVTNAYDSVILGDSPFAFWRLNETNGAVAHDYVGGNNGVYVNSTLGQPGYSLVDSDTAVGFGAGSSPSYMAVSNTAPFNSFHSAGFNTFSLEAWVYFTNFAGGGVQRFFSCGAPGGWGFGADGANELRFTTFGVQDFDLNLSTALVPNIWYHIVGVSDGISLTFYINGQSVGSINYTGAQIAVSQPLLLGRQDNFTVEQLTGRMDEAAIYNYPLNAGQVLAHYNARYATVMPPIVSAPIVTPPTNYEGLSASMLANAAGAALSYQWYQGSTPLVGQTSETLVLSPLVLTNAGAYFVQVTNPAGSSNSPMVTLTVLPPPTDASQLNLTNGLVLHLPFDGDYNDYSGRLNNGTPEGAPSFVSPGAIGASALHYSTTASSSYNYVTLGTPSDLVFSTSVNFSVSLWVRESAGLLPQDLPFFGSAVNSLGHTGITLAPGNGTGGWAWSMSDGVDSITQTGPFNTINDGNWHNLVYTFNRASVGIVYLDGQQVGSQSIVQIGNSDTGLAFNIGQDPTGTYGVTADADIDDIGVWRRVLLPLEVGGIYVGGASNSVSFAATGVTPVALTITNVSGQLEIIWPGSGWTLQGSTNATGPYTNITGASSPYNVPSSSSGDQFYRLKH